MKSSESKKGPEKTPPIEELTITQELQKKFPDYFQQKQSSFFASRSKSPSISLRENLTVEEKAEFIKTYHDLLENKYKKIQSQKENTLKKFKFLTNRVYTVEKYEMILQRLDNKMLDLFRESKKLDIEEEKILKSSDSEELNQKLYDLDNYKYPTSKIFGQNAIYSRKKLSDEKSIAMTGEEFFKFSVLKDLMEVERKIKDEEEKNKKAIDSKLDIKAIEKGELVKTIQKIDESKDFKFSDKDLQTFLDLERNKLKDPSIKTSKEDPLLILKRVIEARKKSLETGTPKQDEKLFKNLLDLIKKKEQKQVTIKFAFHLLSDPNKRKSEKILENINSLKIEKISEKDLKDFLKLSKYYSTTEKISTLETLKKTLETLKQLEPQKENNNTTKILKAVGDYLTKMKQENNLIKTFQNEFKTKSNYEIINLLLKKIETNDLELKIFCEALNKHDRLEFKQGDLKLFLRNLSDNNNEKIALTKLESFLNKAPQINSGNLKILQDLVIRENKEELLKKQPQTTTSLFLGFVPHNCSKFIPKEIKNLVKTPVRFGVRLSEEMQKPDTNIVQALHEVVSNINNKKTK